MELEKENWMYYFELLSSTTFGDACRKAFFCNGIHRTLLVRPKQK